MHYKHVIIDGLYFLQLKLITFYSDKMHEQLLPPNPLNVKSIIVYKVPKKFLFVMLISFY